MVTTKKDIVLKVSEKTKLKQTDVKRIVQETLDEITGSLTKGDKVELRNFGIFKVKTRKGRMGRNPRTGAEVPIPERKVVTFKPGLVMKKDVK